MCKKLPHDLYYSCFSFNQKEIHINLRHCLRGLQSKMTSAEEALLILMILASGE